ncbi:MAG: nucleotide exchange factor GrpE [Bacteroidetes bacterium]|nr:nucleotide exchange factor GrpE [Bacteroidota bacterium]
MTDNIQNTDINNQEENKKIETPETEIKSEVEILQDKIKSLEELILQSKDQFLRKAAEFENYKRRTENDFLSISKYSIESTITHLIPILDDLTRFLNSHDEKEDPFYLGVEMIYNKFMRLLQEKGLKEMECVGKEFDVNFHDAMLQQPSDDVPPNTILQEVEKGYLLYDKVIRHAKVIVSTKN